VVRGISVGAIIVAAGSSRRMGGQDKLLAHAAGMPVLVHTLRAFEQCAAVEQVIVVLSDENVDEVLPLLHRFKKVTRTARGGARRQDSVRNGLFSLSPSELVVVHDGARPLVTPGIISHGLAIARETGVAAAAMPVIDTLKAAREDGRVLRTVPREGLWAVQTPQIFQYDILLRAHERITDDVTDDCAMVERLGYPVHLYEGSRLNLKVTTPEDLRLVDALLRSRKKAADDERRPGPRGRARK
jgi:2-C-methyl-D-erythritol 4-phosphate cytidylyltransferase